MEEKDFKSIKKNIDEGEIIPLYILKNYIDYKIKNNMELDKLMHFYRINDEASFNYLNNINKNYPDIFLTKFNQLKFSLSKKNLDTLSKLLPNQQQINQKEFIDSEPSSMFIKIYEELKLLNESKGDKILIRKQITETLEKYYNMYNEINYKILFPTLIASENYSYNKLIFDYVHYSKIWSEIWYLHKFLKKRNSEKFCDIVENKNNSQEKEGNVKEEDKNKEDKNEEDKNKEDEKEEDEKKEEINKEEKYDLAKDKLKPKTKQAIKFILNKEGENNNNNNNNTLLNKKRNRSDSSTIDNTPENILYKDYDSDEELFQSFNELLNFLELFEEVFKIIKEKKSDEENLLRIQIFLFYLICYEEERSSYDQIVLNFICDILICSTIDEKIFDKCELYYEDNIKVNKEDWKKIKIGQSLDIKIGDEIIKNVKIKFFNTKILELNNDKLISTLRDYKLKYLSIFGLKKQSLLFKTPEIEETMKNYLFNLVKADIIKEGFQLFDPRFDHGKQKYPFKGTYQKEIFEEIWSNIVVIPFIYSNTCALAERTDYKIYLDLYPNKDSNPLDAINILSSKLIDLYHEIFHLITLLYATSSNEYKEDDFTTDIFENNIKSTEIQNIVNKYSNNYPKIMKVNYELTDMGDIMEIYLFGIKPRSIFLYSAIYLLYILEGDKIENIKIDDIRAKISELSACENDIEIQELKDYSSKKITKAKDIYEYFNNNSIWKIFSNSFKTVKKISNKNYKRRAINEFNYIYNAPYDRYRKPCLRKSGKKIKKN